jgi:hypothetical protein
MPRALFSALAQLSFNNYAPRKNKTEEPLFAVARMLVRTPLNAPRESVAEKVDSPNDWVLASRVERAVMACRQAFRGLAPIWRWKVTMNVLDEVAIYYAYEHRSQHHARALVIVVHGDLTRDIP